MNITTAKRAAEHGNWYTATGEQVASVPSADGKKQVKPTIVHARKHDLGPGVTTIIGCAHREDLVRWQINQGIMAALTSSRRTGETDADFVARILDDSKEQARTAADLGTAIHASIQSYFEGGIPGPEHTQHIQGALLALQSACGLQQWATEKGVASAYGYGTKADLSSPEWVVDIKSKDGDEEALRKLKLYESYTMQLAATNEALGGGRRKAGILYVSRTHPGVAVLLAAQPAEMEKGMGMFLALLRYWQIKNNFRPTWAILGG